MKTTIAILIALACARLAAEDFTTIEGKKYEGVTISRVEPDGLMVVTDSGIAKIRFVLLPEDVQKKCGYDPKAAAEFSAGVAKAQRDSFTRGQKALQDEQAKKPAEQEAQRKAALEAAQNQPRLLMDSERRVERVSVGQIATSPLTLRKCIVKMFGWSDVKLEEVEPGIYKVRLWDDNARYVETLLPAARANALAYLRTAGVYVIVQDKKDAAAQVEVLGNAIEADNAGRVLPGANIFWKSN